jgi:hypothetical protein
MSIVSQPEPILRVTVGSPIFTCDEQKIGTVKERRGTAFKVGTPLLQRDFWLRAEEVADATPDGAVYLTVTKAEIPSHRLKEPPA